MGDGGVGGMSGNDNLDDSNDEDENELDTNAAKNDHQYVHRLGLHFKISEITPGLYIGNKSLKNQI